MSELNIKLIAPYFDTNKNTTDSVSYGLYLLSLCSATIDMEYGTPGLFVKVERRPSPEDHQALMDMGWRTEFNDDKDAEDIERFEKIPYYHFCPKRGTAYDKD